MINVFCFRQREQEALELRQKEDRRQGPRLIAPTDYSLPSWSPEMEKTTVEDKFINIVTSIANESQPHMAGDRPWTTDDKAMLSKLSQKYPAGLPRRWEIIAAELKRSVRRSLCLHLSSIYQSTSAGGERYGRGQE